VQNGPAELNFAMKLALITVASLAAMTGIAYAACACGLF
jgi:hypothetical protein